MMLFEVSRVTKYYTIFLAFIYNVYI